MPKKIEISYRTIIFTVFFLLFLKLVSQISEILLMVFVAIILMSALAPVVDRLEKWHLPRALAIFVIYIVLWGILGTLLAGIIPSIVEQTTKLIQLLPTSFNRLSFVSGHEQEIYQQVLGLISSLPQDLLKFTVSLFGNILNFFTTIVITFYMLLDRRQLHHFLSVITGSSRHERMENFFASLEKVLGSWVRGELVLMLSVGLLTYIGLIILGVDIALPLAILAGLLEIVPNIGPVISAVPAVILTLSIHPFLALSTAALYFLVQFLENHLLVPNIMRAAVGVNPVLSIIGLMIGFKLTGPLGAILAIPVIIVVRAFYQEFSSSLSIKNLLS